MTAKEYLSQAGTLHQIIEKRLERIETLRSLVQSANISYGGEVVSHTRNTTSLQNITIRLVEAEDELANEIKQLADKREEIMEFLGQVENADYRRILEKRYLSGQTWNQIVADMHVSRAWVFEQHARALAVADNLLKEQEAC